MLWLFTCTSNAIDEFTIFIAPAIFTKFLLLRRRLCLVVCRFLKLGIWSASLQIAIVRFLRFSVAFLCLVTFNRNP